MNKKEQMQMSRLEIENRELRAKLDKSMDVYREQAWELIDLRTKLEIIEFALRGDQK
jgi:hypothetical protein